MLPRPPRVPRCRRINHRLHLMDEISRNPAQIRMLPNQTLIARNVNAVHLSSGYKALHPLNMRSNLLEGVAGLLGECLQVGAREITRANHVPFDYELWHVNSFLP